ncbi:MAG TPA: aminotransferase class I/II-fold pyridoxal phosphate-dependent enzyme [Azospirillaceae bacterium]|nr:aminotransferase class I/II-fold pyridoxal phosphate-dependent enzyme [Azospirillaceae bacterium]
MPTVQNPLGAVMSEARRRKALEVAERRGLVVMEDAAYACLEENAPPPLARLAPARVVHIDTFAKVAAPGLRAGYVVAADPSVAAALARGVRATTWSASPSAEHRAVLYSALERIRARLGDAFSPSPAGA